ncbi:MAG: hypothetical protein KGS00_11315 [Alphaproteobacteria bacterium]|nr:hypothetical protein [Alphaproteobacteria bacterium]
MKPPEKDEEAKSRNVKEDREKRLARALRANLRRRKATARPPAAPENPDGAEL